MSVDDGFGPCQDGVPGKLQQLINGRFRTIASGPTSASGGYSVASVTDPGRYRTLIPRVTLASGDVCLKTKSSVEQQ